MILSLCQQAKGLCMYGNDHGGNNFCCVIENVATMSMASDIAALRRKDNRRGHWVYEREVYPKASSQNYKLSEFYFEHCSGFDEEESLVKLSGSLLVRVQSFLHGSVVENFPRRYFAVCVRTLQLKLWLD